LNYTPENEDGYIDPISIAESLKYPDNFGLTFGKKIRLLHPKILSKEFLIEFCLGS
jgi:hypothetical protein